MEFNTVDLTLYVTSDRVEEILSLVHCWLDKTAVTVRELQSMLAKLHFVSSCVRPSRNFVSRLLTWLRSLPDDKEYYNIPLFVKKKDLIWWSELLNIFIGVPMMSIDEWSHPVEILESDACLGGCGGWFPERREYFHVVFLLMC